MELATSRGGDNGVPFDHFPRRFQCPTKETERTSVTTARAGRVSAARTTAIRAEVGRINRAGSKAGSAVASGPTKAKRAEALSEVPLRAQARRRSSGRISNAARAA
jgi:hypothetical protein